MDGFWAQCLRECVRGGFILLLCVLMPVSVGAGGVWSEARIYLPFEGVDEGQFSEPWRNKGVTGYNEYPGRAGTNAIATITPEGLKGNAFDARHLTNLTEQSAYMWGDFGDPPAGDTPMEQALIDIWSFTFTGWIHASPSLTQGRIVSSIPLELNYIASGDDATLATRVGAGESFINSPDVFASTNEWIFVAVTYDGAASVSNLNWYVGSTTQSVQWVGSADVGIGQLERTNHGGNLWLGNLPNHTSGTRPFVGRLDELRLWSSHTNTEPAVLTEAELEQVQQYDLGELPPAPPMLYPAVDVASNSFWINWATLPEADAYRVDVATDPDFSSATLSAYSNVVAEAPLFEVTGLDLDVTYYYRVRAENEYGVGDVSETGSARTTSTPAITTSGLQLHLSAAALTHLSDGEPVTEWTDLSGYDHHAVQADPASRPVYRVEGMGGGPTVEFDGSNTAMSIPDLNIPGETTVIIVALDREQTDSASLHKVLLAADNDPYANDASGTGYGFGYRRAGNDGAGVYLSDGTNVNLVIQTGPPSNQPEVLAFRREDQFMSFFRNGRLVNAALLPRTGDFHTGYMLGNEEAFGGRHYWGEIAEVLVYDRALSPVEQLGIEQYLAEQYNLDIPTRPPASGIRLWLHGEALNELDDGQPVSTWADWSPLKNDAVQFHADRQPALFRNPADGRQALRFDGTNQFMDLAALRVEHDMSALFVMKNAVQTGDDGSVHRPVLTAAGAAYRADGPGYGFGYRRPGFDGFFTYLGSGTQLENVGHARLPDGELESVLVHKEGTHTRIFRNGKQVAQGDLNRPSNMTYEAGYRLGGSGASPQYYKGDIAEVLIYDRPLDEQELAQLKRYLVVEHGVSEDTRFIQNGVVILQESYADQPYVTKLTNGQWLAVTTVSPDIENSPERHLVLSWSSDQGQTWTEPVPAIEPPEELRQPSWATLFTTPFGRVYAFYNLNADEGPKPLYCYRYSDDNGMTWSERFLLPVRDTLFEELYGDVRHWGVDQPFVMGDSVYFGFAKFQQLSPRNGEGWLFRSDNLLTETNAHELNWDMLPFGDEGIRNPELGSLQEEHNMVPLEDGAMYTVYRTIEGYAAHAYSRDGGETWETPQFATYEPGGRQIKNPRALPRVWQAPNGRYLLWVHNHDGRDIPARNRNRNPAWVLGGREVDGTVYWSQPEVLLYGPADMLPGMSYPDFIEENGRYWVTHTEKSTARIHEIDGDLLDAVWEQHENHTMTHDGLVHMSRAEERTAAEDVSIGTMPDLLDGGITVEFSFRLDEWLVDETLLDTRDEQGRGWAVVTDEDGALRFELSDGYRHNEALSDPGVLTTGQWHHVAFVADGGPNLITVIADGQLLDGGEERQYGWFWFNPEMGDVTGTDLSIDASVDLVRIYDRYLRTSDVVGNWRDAMGPYMITTVAGANGTMSPANPVVERGDDVTFEIEPDEWYDIADVLVDTVSVGPVTTHTLTNVRSAAVISASFEEQRTENTGTPLWWLAQYGYTNDFEEAALDNLDGTGMKNWEQYVAGTVPTDPESVLQIDQIHALLDDEVRVEWSPVAGRVYALYAVTNLVAPGPYLPVATNLLHPQDQHTINVEDINPGFIRLGVELQNP